MGILAGVAAYGMWGLFPIYFHYLAPASPFEVLVHRMLWTLLVTSLFLTVRKDWGWFAKVRVNRGVLIRVAVGAAMLLTNWTMYIWAVTNDHVVDAALGYFINPLVTVLLGVVVLGERLRRLQLAAVVLGALAVLVLTVGYGKPPVIALVLASSFAMYGYFKKTVDLPAVASLCLETMVMMPVAAIAATVILARQETTFTGHGVGHSVLLLAAGLVTAIPLVLFGTAARRLPLTMLGLLQYLTPVLQMLCGVVLFNESVPLARWIGFLIVWCALAMLVADAISDWRDAPTPELAGPADAVSSAISQVGEGIPGAR
jgi:chloramphenicol-sensitive protein RarD